MMKYILLLILATLLLVFSHRTHGYPSSGLRWPLDELMDGDQLTADDLVLYKRRGMGWGNCGIFKWRCGRQRVIHKKHVEIPTYS